MNEPTFILRGICGSTAHGLAHASSDEDLYGVFSWPTADFWRMQAPADSIVRTSPDEAYHELVKFANLAAKGNPQMLELLWLDDYVDKETRWGNYLLSIRRAFFSEPVIRARYGGYTRAKIRNIADGQLSTGTNKKVNDFKEAKHMFRLLEQGIDILTTGELRPRVEDSSWYLETLPDMTYEQVFAEFTKRYAEFENVKAVIGDEQKLYLVNEYLNEYRRAH